MKGISKFSYSVVACLFCSVLIFGQSFSSSKSLTNQIELSNEELLTFHLGADRSLFARHTGKKSNPNKSFLILGSDKFNGSVVQVQACKWGGNLFAIVNTKIADNEFELFGVAMFFDPNELAEQMEPRVCVGSMLNSGLELQILDVENRFGDSISCILKSKGGEQASSNLIVLEHRCPEFPSPGDVFSLKREMLYDMNAAIVENNGIQGLKVPKIFNSDSSDKNKVPEQE